jgi:hypothetical protein
VLDGPQRVDAVEDAGGGDGGGGGDKDSGMQTAARARVGSTWTRQLPGDGGTLRTQSIISSDVTRREEGSTRNLGTWIPRPTGWRTYLPFVPEEEWRMQQRA